MKHKRLVAGVLSLALACTILSPLQLAFAETSEGGSDGGDSPSETEGLEISKTAVANGDGTYTITLEAYATGSKVITEVSKDIPADIILVLDQSGSMTSYSMYTYKIYNKNTTNSGYYEYTHSWDQNWNQQTLYYKTDDGAYVSVTINREWTWWGNSTYTYTYTIDGKSHTITTSTGSDTNPGITLYYENSSISRLKALKNAVTTFTDNVATKAAGADATLGTGDDVNHRIAVVGFASGDKWGNRDYNYGNTEVLIGNNQYRYGSSAQSVYASAFQDMDTSKGKENVKASINALEGDGGTLTNLGIEMANGIFKSNPLKSNEKRNRVVVVFTDGEPGWSGYDSSIAQAALNMIESTKTDYGATVYTVGIFDGADATSAGDADGTKTQMANWFMQNLSSNEGNVQTPSYYLSASTPEALNNIFQQISDKIEAGGSSIKLGSEAVVKDIISPYFTLPENATESDITVTSWDCSGVDSEGYTWNNETPLNGMATVENGQVSVTGFDFAKNWVGTEKAANGKETYRGKKLVISFTVEPKAGFLGGNDVPTNGAQSGIYANGTDTTALENFTQPTVNVPIDDVEVTAADKNVYLYGSVTADQLKNGAVVTCGGVRIDLSKPRNNYGLKEWQNEYVNIQVEIISSAGGTINYSETNGTAENLESLNNLTEDGVYTIKVTVSPKTSSADASGSGIPAEIQQGSDSANINVFKPELTFGDSEVYYGDTVPTDYSGNLDSDSTVWKHGNTLSTDTSVDMIGTAPTLDFVCTPDLADGKINTKEDIGVDVTVTVKIENNNVNVTDKTTFHHTNCEGKTCTVPDGKEFLLHVKTCQLTITKSNGASGEPYVFYIYKDDKYDEKYSEVTIVGTGSETIYELPVGSYTIREDTGWSWRYSAAYNGNEAVLSATNPEGAITCTNTKSKNYWLNGYSSVVTNVSGKLHTAG